MPGRAVGNQRESTVADALDALGFACIPIKGSGARGARMRRRQNAVIGDMVAVYCGKDPSPHLQIEVGSHSPGPVFRSMTLLPGFVGLFVQYHYPLAQATHKGRKRQRSKVARSRVFIDPHTSFPTVALALAALRER